MLLHSWTIWFQTTVWRVSCIMLGNSCSHKILLVLGEQLTTALHSGTASTSFIIIILFIHIFTTVLSQWDFSHSKFGMPSLGKGSCDSRAIKPMVHVGCFSVSIIHQTRTWTTGSLMCAQCIDCTWGFMDTVRESDWKNPLLQQGIKPASAECQSDALPTELHPHYDWPQHCDCSY